MRFVTRAPRFLSLLIGGAIAIWYFVQSSPRLPILDVAGAAGLPQATPAAASTGRPLEVLFLVTISRRTGLPGSIKRSARRSPGRASS